MNPAFLSSISWPAAAVWLIAALTIGCVLGRPRHLPEAVFAAGGALLLVVCRLLPWRDAWNAVGEGLDVYLFLTGMMLLSELARREGVFDWCASVAVAHAKGSPARLFWLIYGVGVVVTVFLSNDATAVVMTPAVLAATKAARVQKPLPYLFACALVANAASFVLPISNPANLVLFSGHMPPLPDWLREFGVPSILSISRQRSRALSGTLVTIWRATVTEQGGGTGGSQALRFAVGKLASCQHRVGGDRAARRSSAFRVDLGAPTLGAGAGWRWRWSMFQGSKGALGNAQKRVLERAAVGGRAFRGRRRRSTASARWTLSKRGL